VQSRVSRHLWRSYRFDQAIAPREEIRSGEDEQHADELGDGERAEEAVVLGAQDLDFRDGVLDVACAQHEQSHIKDWEQRFPNGCKNADGTSKKDDTQVPTGGEGYDDFLRQSECKAYKIELACEQKLQETAGKDCKPDIDSIVKDRQERVKNCGGGC